MIKVYSELCNQHHNFRMFSLPLKETLCSLAVRFLVNTLNPQLQGTKNFFPLSINSPIWALHITTQYLDPCV